MAKSQANSVTNLVPQHSHSARFRALSAVAGVLGSRAGSARPVDWRRRMSDNIAYALLVYTALQIFVTLSALRGSGTTVLPYLSLVVLVAAIIPACRIFERRWSRLTAEQLTNPGLPGRFRRDQALLWLLASGLPFLITGLFRLLSALPA